MLKINVIVKDRNWFRLLKNPNIYLKKKIKKIQNDKFFKKNNYSFNLKLSDEKEIKLLNKKFRKKNKSTDILSFPFDKKITISKNTYLGDIIISYNYLDNPKSQDSKTFKEKVIKIFIHGFLHLLGYDHVKNSDYFRMLKEENRLYKLVKSKIC